VAEREEGIKILEGIGNYFDLVSDRRSAMAGAVGGVEKLPPAWPQYIALVLGILVQPYFASYQVTGTWAWSGLIGRLLFSAICGFAVLPGVYKSAFDPDKPIVVQLCLLFVAGLGWESLLAAATTALAP